MPKRTSAKASSESFIDSVVSVKGIFILLLVMVVVSGSLYLYARRTTVSEKITAPKITPTPTPTPKPIPHGKFSYTVGGGRFGPQFGIVSFDPYDPPKGTKQIIRMEVRDTKPVASVAAVMKTDHKETPVSFQLVSGSNIKGEWEGTWIADDTYLYTYEFDIVAESPNGKGTPTITLR